MATRSESARSDVVDLPVKFIGPDIDDTNQFFFDATGNGQLAFQRCRACRAWWSLPALACHACGATDCDVVTTSGHGSVHTYAVPRRPSAALIDDGLIFVVVDLDEGLRYFSRLVGVDPADVEFGMRVEVAFAPAESGVMVPVFIPTREGRGDVGA